MRNIRILVVLVVGVTIFPGWDCSPDVGSSDTDAGEVLTDAGAPLDSSVVDLGTEPTIDSGMDAGTAIPDGGSVDAPIITTGDFTVTRATNDSSFRQYGEQLSMTVGADGSAYFAYVKPGFPDRIILNQYADGAWSLRELTAPSGADGADYYFQYATVVLDDAGTPNVIYVANGPGWDGMRCRLNIATPSGDSWAIAEITRQPIDCPGGRLTDPQADSSAIDARFDDAGTLHVVADMQGAVYAERIGGSWNVTRVTTSIEEVMSHPALGVNAAGVVYVASLYVGDPPLDSDEWHNKLFRKDGESFIEVALPTAFADANEYPGIALAVDASGLPHVMIADDVVRYAAYDGSTWHTEIPPTGIPDSYSIGRTTDTPDLFVDESGRVLAAMVQSLDDDPSPTPPHTGLGGVRLMERDAAGAWSVSTIEVTMDDFIHHPNVEVDGSGHVHVGWSGAGPTHAVR